MFGLPTCPMSTLVLMQIIEVSSMFKRIFIDRMKSSFKLVFALIVCLLIHVFWANLIPIWSYILLNNEPIVVMKNVLSIFQLGVLLGLIFSIILSISRWFGQTLLIIINLIATLFSYYAYQFGIQMSDELMVSMLFFVESNDITSSFDWTIFIFVPIIFIPSLIATNYILKKLVSPPLFSFEFKNIVNFLLTKTVFVLTSVCMFLAFLATIYYGAKWHLNRI